MVGEHWPDLYYIARVVFEPVSAVNFISNFFLIM